MNRVELQRRSNARINNPILKKFFLIKDAVETSKNNDNVPIFSCDKADGKVKGSKVFYAAGYEEFWNFYSGLAPTDRCFYETLLPDLACHLYVDVEASKVTNEGVDFDQLISDLLDHLKNFMVKMLKILLSELRVIELDSSTDTKVSKHYIIKVGSNDCYFMNNFHCGAFMRRFQKHVISEFGLHATNKFFVWGEKEELFEDPKNKIFFVDLGVYTLRRQFRLLGSSKLSSKRRYLTLKGCDPTTDLKKSDFFDCLIQYVPLNVIFKRVYKVKEIGGEEPYSRSLKTFDAEGNPISIAVNNQCNIPVKHPVLDVGRMSLDQLQDYIEVQSKKESKHPDKLMLSVELQRAIQQYFMKKYEYNIKSYTVVGDKLRLETNNKRCFIKESITGNGEHSNNHVYLLIYIETLFVFQGCYADKYCKNGSKKLLHPLGKLDESCVEGIELVKRLRRWNETRSHQQLPKKWLPVCFKRNMITSQLSESSVSQVSQVSSNCSVSKPVKKIKVI